MGSRSYCCSVCTQLKGRAIAPLLMKDPVMSLGQEMSWEGSTKMSDSSTSTLALYKKCILYILYKSTRNYLLAEKSGTEDWGNQLIASGIAKLEIGNCSYVWGVSPGLFSMGPPIFRWGWDAEDQVVKCALGFPWVHVWRRSALSTVRSGHAAADTYRQKRRYKFLQQKWCDQHRAEKLRQAECPWHPWIESYKQNEALHEICHLPHELPRVVLKKKRSLEHVMELGIRFSRFPWKIKPALVWFSSPSRVCLKKHFTRLYSLARSRAADVQSCKAVSKVSPEHSILLAALNTDMASFPSCCWTLEGVTLPLRHLSRTAMKSLSKEIGSA